MWKVYLQTYLKALSLLILGLACQPWSVLMKILTWFWNQGAKCRAHRNPFKTCLNIQPRSKIYPVLQSTPTATPRVSKKSQKNFSNKSVEFLLKISWNFEQKLDRFICKIFLWIFWHPWGSCGRILEHGGNLTFWFDVWSSFERLTMDPTFCTLIPDQTKVL